MVSTQAARKRRGAWYTPPELVEILADGVLADHRRRHPGRAGHTAVRVLDPACGDGRILVAVGDRLESDGYRVELTGCDIDADAVDRVDERVTTIHGDALAHDWGECHFDIVVGNPPYLSQMAAATSRGGASRHGGGPYADAAAEFLALAARLADPQGGCVGLVLPQSILGARDAGPVREQVGRHADLSWSWWHPQQRHFDANVNVCALGFRRPSTGATTATTWTRVVTDELGVPSFDESALDTDGTLGDRALLNANFRDEYYALVPAVGDDVDGPPLITSGLIDPGTCHWGHRTVRFAKRDFDHPRVDLNKLEGRFPAWAQRKLVPKVLVANQTRIIEAVADPAGAWLPGVPVTTATPTADTSTTEIAAMLTSPVASALAWHHSAGTGLSPTTVRIGPKLLGGLPWPAGPLGEAVAAIDRGDVTRCGELVVGAFGVDRPAADALLSWWSARLPA